MQAITQEFQRPFRQTQVVRAHIEKKKIAALTRAAMEAQQQNLSNTFFPIDERLLVGGTTPTSSTIVHGEGRDLFNHCEKEHQQKQSGGCTLKTRRSAFVCFLSLSPLPVSYTHLTLPTNREV